MKITVLETFAWKNVHCCFDFELKLSYEFEKPGNEAIGPNHQRAYREAISLTTGQSQFDACSTKMRNFLYGERRVEVSTLHTGRASKRPRGRPIFSAKRVLVPVLGTNYKVPCPFFTGFGNLLESFLNNFSFSFSFFFFVLFYLLVFVFLFLSSFPFSTLFFVFLFFYFLLFYVSFQKKIKF